MAEKVVNLYEAKTRLSLLVEWAAAGETIVIAKVPMQRGRPVRLGSLRGRIRVPEGFDQLAGDEIEAMFRGN